VAEEVVEVLLHLEETSPVRVVEHVPDIMQSQIELEGSPSRVIVIDAPREVGLRRVARVEYFIVDQVTGIAEILKLKVLFEPIFPP